MDKNIQYFFRGYKYDLLTAFFAVISYFISFSFYSDQRIIFILSLLITLISVSLIIYLRLKEKDFYYIALEKRQDKDDWIGRGTFEFTRTSKSYLITNSEVGYIFSKTLNWNDYRYSFEFKILKDCLGAVVRAINLSDYIMLQITDYGIRPHIRINGGWKAWEADEVNFRLDKKISLDKWYKCTIICEKDLVTITLINKNKILFQRSWTIPHERLGFPFPQSENDPKPMMIHFPINLDYGTIGFRNSHSEKAFVKNVLIEKI